MNLSELSSIIAEDIEPSYQEVSDVSLQDIPQDKPVETIHDSDDLLTGDPTRPDKGQAMLSILQRIGQGSDPTMGAIGYLFSRTNEERKDFIKNKIDKNAKFHTNKDGTTDVLWSTGGQDTLDVPNTFFSDANDSVNMLGQMLAFAPSAAGAGMVAKSSPKMALLGAPVFAALNSYALDGIQSLLGSEQGLRHGEAGMEAASAFGGEGMSAIFKRGVKYLKNIGKIPNEFITDASTMGAIPKSKAKQIFDDTGIQLLNFQRANDPSLVRLIQASKGQSGLSPLIRKSLSGQNKQVQDSGEKVMRILGYADILTKAKSRPLTKKAKVVANVEDMAQDYLDNHRRNILAKPQEGYSDLLEPKFDDKYIDGKKVRVQTNSVDATESIGILQTLLDDLPESADMQRKNVSTVLNDIEALVTGKKADIVTKKHKEAFLGASDLAPTEIKTFDFDGTITDLKGLHEVYHNINKKILKTNDNAELMTLGKAKKEVANLLNTATDNGYKDVVDRYRSAIKEYKVAEKGYIGKLAKTNGVRTLDVALDIFSIPDRSEFRQVRNLIKSSNKDVWNEIVAEKTNHLFRKLNEGVKFIAKHEGDNPSAAAEIHKQLIKDFGYLYDSIDTSAGKRAVESLLIGVNAAKRGTGLESLTGVLSGRKKNEVVGVAERSAKVLATPIRGAANKALSIILDVKETGGSLLDDSRVRAVTEALLSSEDNALKKFFVSDSWKRGKIDDALINAAAREISRRSRENLKEDAKGDYEAEEFRRAKIQEIKATPFILDESNP